jgi:hypothetical protein
MARSTAFGRTLSSEELAAMRRHEELDNRRSVVGLVRGAVSIIRPDENQIKSDQNETDNEAPAPFNWEDDPTIAEPTIPSDHHAVGVGQRAVGNNTLLYLTAPESFVR